VKELRAKVRSGFLIRANPHWNFMQMIRLTTIALVLLSASASAVAAQEKKAPPPTEFSTDLGFVSVSGNTSTTTLSFAEKLIRRIPRWEFRQELGSVYGETDGAQTSNMLRALLRADYGLDGIAIYARGAFDKNKFAGVDSRWGEGIGLAWRIKATEINQLNVEGGFELTQQDNLDGTSDSFSALRAAGSTPSPRTHTSSSASSTCLTWT
jgi:hypothetical protein